ncbi:AI-2E family transporter [Amnibacterium kyonggiense]|uniref:Putative PurR-regulated permease PerM n=1 Tax=Amnibacterium kyonggiense TaxID=595671 RepID=A0A4R7FSZ9_9MICO|nr:AI-2E family transporter [Amnibacterium kyonggiense]TDS80980.1 putative PurR-regulated permease PerM [Amnibacterium kyonggiense]
MKLQNPFRTGLIGTLGVLLALAIGAATLQLATILTYVVAAAFLALGLDPLVSQLERLRLPRWLAMLIAVIVVLGVVVAIMFLVVPVIVTQVGSLVKGIADFASQYQGWNDFITQVQKAVGSSIKVKDLIDQAVSYLQDNAGVITGGVLSVGVGIIGGVGGAVIVIILTLYFTASLNEFKGALYRMVPMSRRARFASIAEQIFSSVGRYVLGQVGLALINGVLSFIFLSLIGAQLPAVFAFIAFLGSLIPLVGTVSAAVLIVLGQIVLILSNGDMVWPSSGLPVWLWVAIYYLVYMQVEAYVLSPNIMNRAVKVPGVIVVIAALVGGTLLGILGALIAIPVAAAVLLVIDQVVVPRQAEA